MNYKQANEYLDEFSNYERKAHLLKARFSLEGIEQLMGALDRPHERFPSVHVAGTVGKGSVCRMIDGALKAAGMKTGLYTSPHLVDVRERIEIGGKVISRALFAAGVERLRGIVGECFEEYTYFEMFTALAFDEFARSEIDVAVVETGLGGRLDSTNVVPPFIAVITTLGNDHAAVLGPGLADIAKEKAGIIKAGASVVSSAQNYRAARVIDAVCRERGAELSVARPSEWLKHEGERDGREVFTVLKGQDAPYRIRLSLTGGFQAQNLATALCAIENLSRRGFDITRDDIIDGIEGVKFAGRMQWLKIKEMEKPILLDGAHNEPAAKALARALISSNWGKPVFIAGMMKDKDSSAVMKELASAGETIIVCDLPFDRACSSAGLSAIAGRHFKKVMQANGIEEALSKAKIMVKPGDFVCVTGSLYAVAEALRINK